jgi:hypothetical protein
MDLNRKGLEELEENFQLLKKRTENVLGLSPREE